MEDARLNPRLKHIAVHAPTPDNPQNSVVKLGVRTVARGIANYTEARKIARALNRYRPGPKGY